MDNQEPVFKPYEMDQQFLFPPSLSELVPENHLVRIVSGYIDRMDLSEIKLLYKGGGTSSYHYRMMLKVIIYAYTEKIYSSRRIAKALRENINFMWIAANNKPDHRTLNRFRMLLTKSIGDVFQSTIELLYEEGYINLENYFLDGTKVEANANKYTFVWKKNVEKNKKKLQEKVVELLKQIDEVNEEEDRIYGDRDLPEMGGAAKVNSELLKKKAAELSEKLKKNREDKEVQQALKKIETDYLPRMEKYEKQEGLFGDRNSFSKTDTDATFMRMKEDHMKNGQLKPGYNVQMGTENQFIVGYSVHQRPGDTTTFIPHMEEVLPTLPKQPYNVVTDAGYGSEENYEFVKREDIGNYLKYNNFRIEETRKIKKDLFRQDNLKYDPGKDVFNCPGGKELKFSFESTKISDNGHVSQLRNYECENCEGCPLRDKCHKRSGNRKIQVNFRLKELRAEAKKNLESKKGVELRKLRGVEVESGFGDIKWNAGFKRFMLRGKAKVSLEWGLVSLGHNFRKLCIQFWKKMAQSGALELSSVA